MTEIRVGPAMSEDDLLLAVLTLCRWLGVAAYHTHDSRRSQPGFPDLVIAGPGGHLFRELKSAKGRLSGAQVDWMRTLNAGRADASVWRPADLASGLIREQLKAIR